MPPTQPIISGQMEFCRESLIRDQQAESLRKNTLVDPEVLLMAHASLAMRVTGMFEHFSGNMQAKFLDACVLRGEELGITRAP